MLSGGCDRYGRGKMNMAVARVSAQFECSAEVDLQSVAFLSQMVSLVPGIIYVFNHQTMSNEYANRSIAELLGYGPEEVRAMGDNLLPTIVHPDDFNRLAEHVGSLQNLSPGQQAIWEYRALHRDGREVWLRSIETVFTRAADGSVMRHIGIAFDITVEKTAELNLLKLNAELEERVRERTEELKQLNAQLESRVIKRPNELISINRDLEQLSYVAAHDLKVPVNNMASLTHMLEETMEAKSEEHAETLRWMRDACEQAAQKLEALVVVAQANAMPDMPFVDVDIASVVERINVSLHYAMKENKAVVRTYLKHDTVWFLPQEVENILQALISNAMKYCAPDRPPRICVGCQRKGEFVVVTVSDNGLGLDLSRDREKVFGLFKRAHVTPSGAGVALYTISRIMERIGGSIDVESRLGEGSDFLLSFPCAGQSKV